MKKKVNSDLVTFLKIVTLQGDIFSTFIVIKGDS